MGRLLNFLLTKKIEEDGEGGEATTGSAGVASGGATTTDHIAIYAKKLTLARRLKKKRSRLRKRKENAIG